MVDWNFLIHESALLSVLPDDYARFSRPISDGLRVFLEGLPAERQADILGAQASLPPTATVSERLARLAECCPALHKLGQVLARDRRLAPELRKQLRRLESLAPTVPLETIQQILGREYGSLDRLGVTLQPPAFTEASVAVVIPFRSRNRSGDGKPRQGVFKILKPGIEQRLEQELNLLQKIGAHLDQRCDDFQIPHLDYQDTFEEVTNKLRCEVLLDQEQRYLGQARAIYADEPRFLIPGLFDFCTPQVTAMERVNGGKVTGHRLDSLQQRRQLADLVVDAMIAQPIFSKTPRSMFHSDPHAGNLFLTADGRLAILDWSLVGTLDERERTAIVQIMLGALGLHAKTIVTILTELTHPRVVDRRALESVVGNWLRRLRQGQVPGLRWLVGMLGDAVQNARLRIAADMMLFRKSLHTLEGVLGDLRAGACRMDEVLLCRFIRHLVVEWPQRWVSSPNSHEFATRLSNLDLTRYFLSLPAAATRYWRDQLLDLLRGYPLTANGPR